jgi:SUMO ligase MMS21 Smc5/6 complex component
MVQILNIRLVCKRVIRPYIENARKYIIDTILEKRYKFFMLKKRNTPQIKANFTAAVLALAFGGALI